MSRPLDPPGFCRKCETCSVISELRVLGDGFQKEVFTCMSCGFEWVLAFFGIPVRSFTEKGARR